MQLFRAFAWFLAVTFSFCCETAFASDLAELTGFVSDPTGARVSHCRVQATNLETNVSYFGETNDVGLYRISAVPVGEYRVIVQKQGFKTIVKQGIELHVQDILSLNFEMQIGAVAESITIVSRAPLIDTESAAVSTVVDRNFAENIPLNGRSFQALVELAPGVVTVPVNTQDEGQFSVNGQRASANYWMVDGVSANAGIGVVGASGNGNTMAGSLGSYSVLGGTNSLVSVDAMQEFRIQTSTYAPEFGRTPGGQISIATRSGSNQFHGTLYDYLRNDALDANNWFNTAVTPALPKAKERQNDFGGTFSGRIFKDRTFFFFSYEGLRLRLPQTVISTVPDLTARQNATPAMQPFLKAYPLPNGTDNPATGSARFNSSFSSSATLDASSLRLDHRLNNKINLFARYNYSPSEISQRGSGQILAPSVVTPIQITIQTGTAGATWSISPNAVDDLRFNYSRTNAKSHSFLDNFGGAVPLASLPFPSPFSNQSAQLTFIIALLQHGALQDGASSQNSQRQINLVNSLSLQKRSHAFRFGVDYRRLSPVQQPAQYLQTAVFIPVIAAETGSALVASTTSSAPAFLLFRNIGAFAQDTWHVNKRLTLTYGARWDVDFAPTSTRGPGLPAYSGFNLNNFSQLAVAPAGTPPFKTPYGNVAPRIGVAYQARSLPDWQMVLRGGFGVFYDLASAQAGVLAGAVPPFGQSKNFPGAAFPLSPANSAPPTISPFPTLSQVLALNPDLQLPYTLQWNVAVEQMIGRQQALTLSYVGAAGRRLLQTTFVQSPTSNPTILSGQFVDNSATSDYDALQAQFQRHLSQGLQVQASYTWAHSFDTASAGSVQVASNQNLPGSNGNRGPSDFDIRHAASLTMTYDLPAPSRNAFMKAIVHGWSVQNAFQARSAPPVDVTDGKFSRLNGVLADIHPDLVPGQPLYLFGSQFPGGKAFNPAAFTDPPFNPITLSVFRQGNVPRNFLRGFGLAQYDLGVHRSFPLRESIKLQFRAEMFNVLNHPNFGQPNGIFNTALFGSSSATLNASLAGSGTVGAGSFNPLYQLGGPRSIQFALKFMF
jgi:hypothetical protein